MVEYTIEPKETINIEDIPTDHPQIIDSRPIL